jgi:hypothetical protein
MDLRDISTRTRIDVRRLRYVLEYGLMPNSSRASKGRGSARQFSKPETILLTFAALMLDAGIRRQTVKFVTKDLADHFVNSRGNLEFDVTSPPPDRTFVIEIADGVNRRGGAELTAQTPWVQMKTGAKVEAAYRPLALIRFDMAELARRLFQ